MTKAQYSEPDGKWIITIQRLFTGLGVLSRWNWPDIPGLKEFQGKVIHSARWETGEGGPDAAWEDTVKNWGDKRVGVIGVVSYVSAKNLYDLDAFFRDLRQYRSFLLYSRRWPDW